MIIHYHLSSQSRRVNLGWVKTNPLVLDGINWIIYVHQLRLFYFFAGYLRLAMVYGHPHIDDLKYRAPRMTLFWISSNIITWVMRLCNSSELYQMCWSFESQIVSDSSS